MAIRSIEIIARKSNRDNSVQAFRHGIQGEPPGTGRYRARGGGLCAPAPRWKAIFRPLPLFITRRPRRSACRRSTQYFRCFGCDAKGDVFKFVELIEGLTFFEALKKLADQHGIALPKQSLASDDETRLRAALYEMHEIAANQFRTNLAGSQGSAARQYLAKRGVSEAAVQQFGLGFADSSGRSFVRILEQRGFKPEQMEASGLVGQRDDGSFYDRSSATG